MLSNTKKRKEEKRKELKRKENLNNLKKRRTNLKEY